eukprot:6213608-Pleurochrysis_carterae.AAC.2
MAAILIFVIRSFSTDVPKSCVARAIQHLVSKTGGRLRMRNTYAKHVDIESRRSLVPSKLVCAIKAAARDAYHGIPMVQVSEGYTGSWSIQDAEIALIAG